MEEKYYKNNLEVIEKKLKEALADEEQAAIFYESLKTDIEIVRSMNLPQKDRDYLNAMQAGITEIRGQELKHKERITNMLRVIQELRKTLEPGRTAGKYPVLRSV